jgi:elongation factor P
MIDVNDLRKGVTFELDGKLYKVLDYAHNKPGRGNATIRIKARDLRSGTNLEKTFSSGDRVMDARLDFHTAQYLYRDGDNFIFMDTETFEQPGIPEKIIHEVAGFLKEGMEVKLTFYNNEPIDIDLPTSVDLKVVRAEMAVKGDTATGVTKRVTVETGAEVQVDTRTGSYGTRV